MTFPAVASRTTTTSASGHTINYPATVNAGDTLIVFLALDNSASNVVTIDGFTLLRPDPSEGGQVVGAVGWRKADGTEGGGTFTVTTAQEVSAVVYRITGAVDPYVVAPFMVAASGGSITPDPPSNTHPHGSDDYLWIAAAAVDLGATVSSYPAGYSGGTQAVQAAVTCATADRTAAAATENPGTFTMSGAEEWVTFTVAVAPATQTFTDGYAVPASASSIVAASGASVNVPYPDGIQAGDVLVCWVGQDNSSTDVTFPAGWTRVVNLTNGSQVFGALGWVEADGTESGTFTVTGSAQEFNAQCFRLTNAADTTVTPPTATSVIGATATPDPPSHDAGASDKWLWMVFYAADLGKYTLAYPVDYVNGSDTYQGAVTTGAAMRYREIQTEDPGAFTVSAGDQWVTATLSVLGVPAPTPPNAPTGPSATALSSSQIRVDWTAATGSPTGHRVERSLNGTSGWTNVSGSLGAAADTYTDSGLTASTQYFYRVVAFNADGDSPPSTVVNATTQAGPTPPGGRRTLPSPTTHRLTRRPGTSV